MTQPQLHQSKPFLFWNPDDDHVVYVRAPSIEAAQEYVGPHMIQIIEVEEYE